MARRVTKPMKVFFIVNDRNEILLTGTVDQILHAGGNAHRHIVPPVGDFHNPMVFRLPQVHPA